MSLLWYPYSSKDLHAAELLISKHLILICSRGTPILTKHVIEAYQLRKSNNQVESEQLGFSCDPFIQAYVGV